MLDTHAIARRLTDSGLPTQQVDPMTNILREAAEQGLSPHSGGLRAELASLKAHLRWRFADAVLAQTLAIDHAIKPR